MTPYDTSLEAATDESAVALRRAAAGRRDARRTGRAECVRCVQAGGSWHGYEGGGCRPAEEGICPASGGELTAKAPPPPWSFSSSQAPLPEARCGRELAGTASSSGQDLASQQHDTTSHKDDDGQLPIGPEALRPDQPPLEEDDPDAPGCCRARTPAEARWSCRPNWHAGLTAAIECCTASALPPERTALKATIVQSVPPFLRALLSPPPAAAPLPRNWK